jgi:uncharacterized membrane protein
MVTLFIFLFVGFIVVGVVCGKLFISALGSCETSAAIVGGFCGMIALVALFMAIVMPFIMVDYIGSSVKAELINTECGTNYTPKQIFFAEDIVEEIREVQRTRIEIQGLK